MAVIVKNTFLDVVEFKFLRFDEPVSYQRRCQSIPPTWKPVMFTLLPVYTKKRTLSMSSSSSTQSDLSFHSALESFEALSSNGDFSVKSQSGIESNSFDCYCSTPTSSTDCPGSPRELVEESVCSDCICLPLEGDTDELGRGLCFVKTLRELNYSCESDAPTEVVEDNFQNNHGMSMPTCNDPSQDMEMNHVPRASGTRTRLKSASPAFQPAPKDASLDAVTNAVYLALVSCGLTGHVRLEKGLQGVSPTTIGAEMGSGFCSSPQCYDALQVAKKALTEITQLLPTVTLLSARVQKEELGYSLRSSVACAPNCSQEGMCWDAFRKGYCPRRTVCQWYHPQESDIARLKINIRYVEEMKEFSSVPERVLGAPARPNSSSCVPIVRHKISLGQLI